MLKKCVSMLVAISVFIAPAVSFASPSDWSLNTTKVADGNIGIQINLNVNAKLKVLVQKGTDKYYYDINPLSSETLPLQLGNGTYTVALLQNTTGNSYKRLDSQTVTATGIESFEPFLSANSIVKWAPEDDVVLLAKFLTKNANTDEEKIKAIYTYISTKFSYDYKKASTVASGYVPDVDAILASGKGICYDYSAVMASMLRSQGIATKLNMGYKNDLNVYHAWNEVYVKSTGKWSVIDATYDNAFIKAGQKISMIKTTTDYTVVKSY